MGDPGSDGICMWPKEKSFAVLSVDGVMGMHQKLTAPSVKEGACFQGDTLTGLLCS